MSNNRVLVIEYIPTYRGSADSLEFEEIGSRRDALDMVGRRFSQTGRSSRQISGRRV